MKLRTIPTIFPFHASRTLQALWTQCQDTCIVLEDGVVYRQWINIPGKGSHKHLQLLLPHQWTLEISGPRMSHSSTWLTGRSLRSAKTLARVQSRFYWPGQRRDVNDWCKTCTRCASWKSPITSSSCFNANWFNRNTSSVCCYGHPWTTTGDREAQQACSGNHWLLHQVGWGSANSKYLCRDSSKEACASICLPFWSPRTLAHQSRQELWFSVSQGGLPITRYWENKNNSILPQVKWACWTF